MSDPPDGPEFLDGDLFLFFFEGKAEGFVFVGVAAMRAAFLEGDPTPPGAGDFTRDPGGLFSPSCEKKQR